MTILPKFEIGKWLADTPEISDLEGRYLQVSWLGVVLIIGLGR